MARNADMVRSGEEALHNQETANQDTANQQATGQTGGEFSGIPNIEHPRGRAMVDFPVFSQISHEIAIMAEVVDQVNRISDYISGRPITPPAEPAQQPMPPQQAPIQQPQDAPQQIHQQPMQQPPAQPAEPPPVDEPTEEEMEHIYEELYEFVEGVTQATQEGRVFSVEPSFVLISRAVDVPRATDVLYRRAIYTGETGDAHGFASSVVLHSVNVAIYSLKIGEGLGYNRNQLIDLGVSGLLHDVGMVKLPAELFSKGRFSQHDIDYVSATSRQRSRYSFATRRRLPLAC